MNLGRKFMFMIILMDAIKGFDKNTRSPLDEKPSLN